MNIHNSQLTLVKISLFKDDNIEEEDDEVVLDMDIFLTDNNIINSKEF
jgi:hypothetical protein